MPGAGGYSSATPTPVPQAIEIGGGGGSRRGCIARRGQKKRLCQGTLFWRNATCSSRIKAESLSLYVVNTIAYYVEGYYGSFVLEENSTVVTVFGAEEHSGLLNRSKYRSTRQKKIHNATTLRERYPFQLVVTPLPSPNLHVASHPPRQHSPREESESKWVWFLFRPLLPCLSAEGGGAAIIESRSVLTILFFSQWRDLKIESGPPLSHISSACVRMID